MASGVQVSDQVKDIYSEMKVVKSDACESERLRLVIFKIQKGYIVVEENKAFMQKDIGDENAFKFLLSQLSSTECRYLLYDCHYVTAEDIKKEELMFLMWTPDTAACKEKMQYASSKGYLRAAFSGIKHEWDINYLSDCNFEELTDKLTKGGKKSIRTVEGKSV